MRAGMIRNASQPGKWARSVSGHRMAKQKLAEPSCKAPARLQSPNVCYIYVTCNVRAPFFTANSPQVGACDSQFLMPTRASARSSRTCKAGSSPAALSWATPGSSTGDVTSARCAATEFMPLHRWTQRLCAAGQSAGGAIGRRCDSAWALPDLTALPLRPPSPPPRRHVHPPPPAVAGANLPCVLPHLVPALVD